MHPYLLNIWMSLSRAPFPPWSARLVAWARQHRGAAQSLTDKRAHRQTNYPADMSKTIDPLARNISRLHHSRYAHDRSICASMP